MRDAIDRTLLARQLADAALLHGSFTLRSGRTSRYYLDKYRFTTRPEILTQLASLFSARIAAIEADTGPVQRLAGAELGGIPLVTATGIATGKPILFVRNAKKDYGTAKQLEGVLEAGDRVVLLEDVATTGGQALEATAVITELGGVIAGVISTVDRLEGAAERFRDAGVRYEALFDRRELGIADE